MLPPTPPYSTDVTLKCLCGKTVIGKAAPAASWEQEADLAERSGWLPVLKGDVVGASGAVRYACSSSCQSAWLQRL